MEQYPVVVFVLAVLAVPGVTSIVTSALRKAGAQIDPRVIVYAASLAITGLILRDGSTVWPSCEGIGPAECLDTWLAWTVVNAELARRVYELLLSKLPALDA